MGGTQISEFLCEGKLLTTTAGPDQTLVRTKLHFVKPRRALLQQLSFINPLSYVMFYKIHL